MSCESCGEPLEVEETFARFIYYNFGGWLENDPQKWRGLRHVPVNVEERVVEIHEEHKRTGKLPEWCEVKP